MRRQRRGLRALALFVLAPYVGEFVLGNQPITALLELPLLATMYGGGAVLVREVGRRTRSGWPVMVLLAVAYALVEEGLVDQMLFNPAYLGLTSFADQAAVPGMGISARLTVDSVALHATGSTCVPIALVEAFDRGAPRPWLGRRGLVAVAVVFVAGSAGLAVLQAVDLRFVGSPAQFAVTAAAVAGLIALAVRRARQVVDDRRGPAGAVPRPRTVLLAAFGVTTGFWLLDLFLVPVAGAWVGVCCGAAVLAGGAVLLSRASRRAGWGSQHRLAAACGALPTYLWLAPVNTAQLGIPPALGAAGNVVFGASAVLLAVAAWRADAHRRPVEARV
ncbi:hypothetical protein [Kineococcus rhizosphaerae]|uniref:Uncharacterized protein n=1 Tax=Kineococcus rhizosphaerae TaxID=559628 RepID=A0A2T0R2H4_9ACTN|nr:hypothetical protein [Kineococcus rhizosphaerae]PRY13980.1 hypothetical protein CLV37_10799 [Kineococcus rhizosphaerae]